MTTLIFRAPDTVTALEMVQRKMGDDALILSTESEDGQVVVKATTDPEVARAASKKRRAKALDEGPAPELEEVVHESLQRPEPMDVAQPDVPVAAKAVDVLIDEPPPAEEHPHAALPRFLDRAKPTPFAEIYAREKGMKPVLRAVELATPQTPPLAAPRKHGFSFDLEPIRERVLASGRIVIMGPVGAGKCQIALQLATALALKNPDLSPVFFFCGTGSRCDAAFLAHKSHLLGMDTRFDPPADLPRIDANAPQIVVISGRNDNAVELARQALDRPGAIGLLALPAGLRRSRMEQVTQDWSGLYRGVVVSVAAGAEPDESERSEMAEAGLHTLWHSAPNRMVEGLSVPKPVECKSALDAAFLAQTALLHGKLGEERRT